MVLAFAALVLLLAHKRHPAQGEDDGILYQLFQRAAGGRSPRPE